ncbi:protein of unknown function [Georgfuchsia toluolica]|uniref:HTH cro/C1-type domain-containing protein n=1 Tax=Georgfuchsia toluolica TaxID=424218 RepID=A0A916J4B2_9PROT|nr:helix-turn-helix transcriptional regulator [Georgfuchsia toluolica]CAG4883711.1 protein of unknown function [Georgfuchsia toluolica]
MALGFAYVAAVKPLPAAELQHFLDRRKQVSDTMANKKNTELVISSVPPPPPEEGIGQRIQEKRQEYKISVDQLAALTSKYDSAGKSGISRATIYAYESGGTKPGARELRLLCLALNVSPNWLLLGYEWNQAENAASQLANALIDLLDQAESSKLFISDKGKLNSRSDTHARFLFEVKDEKK